MVALPGVLGEGSGTDHAAPVCQAGAVSSPLGLLPFGLHLGRNLAQGVFGFPISGPVVPGIFAWVPDELGSLTYAPEPVRRRR